jgi:pyruvate/2-oxoacid:ferredoxin oxidoreductase alpha subunit
VGVINPKKNARIYRDAEQILVSMGSSKRQITEKRESEKRQERQLLGDCGVYGLSR